MQTLQQAIKTEAGPAFQLITSAEGVMTKQQLETMTLTEFCNAWAGTSVEPAPKAENYEPQMYLECVTSAKDHYYPELKPPEERDQKLFLEVMEILYLLFIKEARNFY
jgi:hypothetical protein